MSRDVFLDVMHRSGEFSLEVSQQVEKRSDRARFSIEDLVFKDARSRLARKLLELDEKPGSRCPGNSRGELIETDPRRFG
ncbi:hypothetical protein [Aliamphritea spongicola]|nr:hypothetical protein [Aliamphritea spongicola]